MSRHFWKGIAASAAFWIGLIVLWYATITLAQNFSAVPVAPGIAPVGTPVFVNVGSMGADVLTWLAAVFTPVLGTMITAGLYQLFKKMGIDMTDAMRARLQELVVNGLNVGAAKATDALRSAPPMVVKNAAVAHAIDYVQTHGADTLKALGFDPKDPKAIEAIQARVESAIINPDVPTHPVLNTDAPKANGASQGGSFPGTGNQQSGGGKPL